jgi:hypothetical protein
MLLPYYTRKMEEVFLSETLVPQPDYKQHNPEKLYILY